MSIALENKVRELQAQVAVLMARVERLEREADERKPAPIRVAARG